MAGEEKLREYLKKATGELKVANRRLREVELREREPIAIVGMSCRYPGGVASPEDLWDLVGGGGDGVVEFPGDRGWDVEGVYDPDPERAGKSYVRHGGFLERAGEFDPGFFGIGPREALAMDPQQRLLLEGAWEALEDAGIAPAELRGSATGVFAGVIHHDYAKASTAAGSEVEGHQATGVPASVVTGRVAYALGLEGPAVTIDTACSSSLVALHLAAAALRAGECGLALAGGVSVMATPGMFVVMSRQRALAPDGRCKSFSADADGTGWGEGSGLLLLERLSDAERNGRRILAVIRGSATNQDGASNGLTAPNGPSQERVIRQALANAGLKPSEVDAVEAHGTGTTLGDPIEAQAVLSTYGQERGERGPLALGSLKSNVGHTQAAAGVGGVIKMVMALREEALPKTLHVSEPSPHVDWETGEVELLTEQKAWPKGERPRRAGVSSFGISGTNAHLILEEPPEQPEAPVRDEAQRPPALPFALSAKTPEALAAAAGRLAAHVEEKGSDPLDVAHSLLATRAQLEHRAVLVGADSAELLEGLDALAQGRPAPNLATARATNNPKTAFLFPGQGSQWLGMASELIEQSPVFAEQIARCEEALSPYLETPLTELLRSEDESWLSRVELVQPALFAVMVSLAELWRSYGVKPSAVIGHSQGEIAAAVVAGALSLEDGAKLAALRAKALVSLMGKGEMASVAASPEEIAESLEPYGTRVAIAAHNGPKATVFSGEPDAIKELIEAFEAEGKRARLIPVGYASHCAQIEAIEAELKEAISDIAPQASDVPFYSTLEGEPIETTSLDAEYWYRNLREPVRLHEATQRLLADGFAAFVEASPHPVLSMAVQETAEAEGKPAAILASLRREEGDARRFVASLGKAHAHGVAVDFGPLFAGTGASATELPTYPFQRERFWLEAGGGAGDLSSAGIANAAHPLLGASIALATEGTVLLTGRISTKSHPWLLDHAVAGTLILPGTGFVELALRAGQEVGARHLRELILETPLVLPEDGAVQLQVAVTADEDGTHRLEIHSRTEPESSEGEDEGAEDPAWTRHASGTLSDEEPAQSDFDAAAWPPPGAEPVATEGLYDSVATLGLDYGPAFQGLEAAWKLGDHIYAEVSLAEEQAGEADRFGAHPALLDAALHAAMLGADPAEGMRLPFSFAGVSLGEGAGASSLRVRVGLEGEKLGIDVADADGVPVATIASLATRAVDPAQLRLRQSRSEDSLLGLDWTEVELSDRESEEEVEVFACDPDPAIDPAAAAHDLTANVLARLQAAIADPEAGRLAFLTRGAVALEQVEAPDPAMAAVWGLVRSAQSEHPGRFGLLDTDGSEASAEALGAALRLAEEPQLALRAGIARAPRLARAAEGEELALPEGPWCLRPGGDTFEELAAVPNPDAELPLGPTEVRVAVRAAGINFRDVLMTLGMGAGMGATPIGNEGAGTVLEVGSEVTDLAPGERVFGYLRDAFAPLARTERSHLAPLPEAWSFEQGAALPVVFGTAYYGLHEIAGLKEGQRVLVHAGAGGVGTAAIQLARHLGAEVFATASPAKWDSLRGLGLDEDHIASSRDLEFRDKFLSVTGGEGMDVVLNSLAREFVDASLELLPRGGHFLEMGKTDPREPEQVAAAHPGVLYRPFSLGDEHSTPFEECLAQLLSLSATGAIEHAPISAWDVRDARAAFRFLSQGRHTGKLVLRMPRALDPEGTVLITGGLGGIGALTARHLAGAHGARRLLLSSRRGPAAPGATELIAELTELGCEATAVACDVSDRAQVEKLLAGIDPGHPLTAVYHCAVVLDDGVVESLDPSRLDAVLAPKADAAWHLHELTADLDLAAFVLYSSAAAALGNPGQGNYAAANSFLEALAQRRRAEGLPATAIAWGLWAQETESTGHLGEEDRARLARAGVVPIETERGLELLDRACGQAAPLVVAMPLEIAALRTAAGAGALPPLLSGLVTVNRRRARAASGSLARRLAGLPEAEREGAVLALVREHAAAVLGHSSAAAIDPETPFKELGFDSLGAVELRNRLVKATGVGLEGTVVFDYPTPAGIARYLLDQVAGGATAVAVRAARGSEEPIAIVGMSCRFPGDAGSPAGLWELLAAGGDGIAEFPADRGWDVDALYDPDPDHPGTTSTRHGGLIEAAGDFDPAFFGIGPNEALAMDPQQRLLLEGAWEAVEDAGVDPTSLRQSATAVIVGISSQDYGHAGFGGAAASELEGLRLTGQLASIASGRVAYTLGLEGPTMTVDTACSSSLVAIHLAAQALRGGECELALAGGATVLASPHGFVEMSRQRALAPDGRCRSFSADADGTGFSEGSGLLLLERLSDAERNGRRILAVIRGSATNQDGASNGLTAPNGPSQERVIRQALANAGLKPGEVDAVEAHGTGTTLGDPIEAQALLATYGQERENGPLQLGSLKSNIGHTQAAAGVGGVIKMVMALREEALPRTLHVGEPTPHVDWSAGEIELLTEQREWKRGEKPRRAGISSFGISGTNAHLILEEAPEPAGLATLSANGEQSRQAERPPVLPFALSAKGPEALAEAAGRLAAHVEERDADVLDVAHSLLTTRAQLEHRAVVVGSDTAELMEGLDALAQGKAAPNLTSSRKQTGPLAFLLSGQGSQQPQMGKGLHEAFPVYAKAFDETCAALEAEGIDAKAAVFAEPGSAEAETLNRTDLTQASLFAVQVALFRLVSSFGLTPDYLLGHSIGEIAAAHLAGVLSLQDAAKLVAARGSLMAALPEGGAMASVRASEAEVAESLEPYEGKLAIAAVNAPGSVTVSGDEDAFASWEAEQGLENRKTRRLEVSHAFHSHRMEPMLAEFEAVASTLSFSAPELPVISNLTGEPLTDEQATSPKYWCEQIRNAVRFADGIAHLNDQGTASYLELGPDAILTALAAEALADADSQPTLAAALRRERPDAHSFLLGLGAMHAGGASVDFAPLFAGTGASATELPTYPFQRQRYWLKSSQGAGDVSSLGQRGAEHPMLGAAISLPQEGSHLFTGRLSVESHPWLADHVVAGTVIVPGVAFAELALRAGREVGAPHLRELVFEAPLALPEDGAVQLRVSVRESADGEAHEVEIHSRPDLADAAGDGEPTWIRHASGALGAEEPTPAGFDATAWPPAGAEAVAVDDFYDEVATTGLELGPAFQGLEAAWRLGEDTYAEVSLAGEQAAEADRFGIHPALLDATLHPAMLAGSAAEQGVMVLFSLAGLALEGSGHRALRVRLSGGETMRVDAADAEGNPVLSIESAAARPLDPARLQAAPVAEDDLFDVSWQGIELPADPEGGEDVELFECAPDPDADPVESTRALTAAALERLRAHLADDDAGSRLAFVTRGAMAVAAGESPDPAAAAVWGLVRSAQSEHPGRFLLIDTDGTGASAQAIAGALRLADEPQLALREGAASAPRLAKVGEEGAEPPSLDPDGTVLVTGGLSGLGSLAARHLATAHGAKRLLLSSRRGAEAPGAAELIAELAQAGCEATAVACDVSDRAQLEQLLAGIEESHPLTAVVHCAGVLDDGVVESLDSGRLATVLAPKAEAAWHLHELTRELDLAAFVLYSSAAATIGSPGQANYAAANSFLDALAQRRRAEGLAATAIAWGLWEQESGMGAELAESDRARIERGGIVPIEAARGLELLDRALSRRGAVTVAVPLRRAALRTAASAGLLPPLFSGLVKVRRRGGTASGALARRLAAVPTEEREAFVLELVREQAADVLGRPSAASIDPEANFKDLGFDSLGAVELRNRLAQATGVRLDATLVFDRPTVKAVSAHLLEQVEGSVGPAVAVRAARGSDEPIAIVGMSCRFPGDVASPAQLWRLLAAGGDGVTPFPEDRGWDVEAIYDPEPGLPGKTYSRHSGFLHEAPLFDSAFFGIGPREATAMDPQQRLFLEGAWEAIEAAGIDPAVLRGSATGVFAGMSAANFVTGEAAPEELSGHILTGITPSIASGRIAYTLGLEGPTMTVDTACSSSLVAMHLAAGALRGGECELALAGGVTALWRPDSFVEFARQQVISPDGRCRSFSADADGTGFSEGSGMLVLERLSDAKRNGRRILAVIKGSATNQDGASNGLTAPNGPSQERVIRQALANAGLKPSEVDAVEAHGTGTVLGDPIEAQALLATYGQERENGPLALGSLKSNVGHTQAAAGVAGVIKMVMALREEALPKTLHVGEPTPHVDWSAGEIELLTEQRQWKRGDRPRRAGISSFGISGTNVHLIVEEAPAEAEAPEKDEAKRPPALPFALSAKGPEALAEAAGRLAAHVEERDLDSLDVAHSLLATRAQLDHRAVVVGSGTAELLEGLDALAQGKAAPNLTIARKQTGSLAFLLSGQGSQQPRMGVGLYESFPVYTEAFDEACAALEAEGIDVKAAVFAEPGSELAETLNRTDLTQASLFTIQVALFRLVSSFGLKPDYLLGHSIGEISAAHLAGVLSLNDAAKLVAARGSLMAALPEGGAMASVRATEAEVKESLAPYEGKLTIAAINAPGSVTVSGDEQALSAWEAEQGLENRKTRRLEVSHAFHSHRMEPMLAEFEAVASTLSFKAPQLPVISNLTGEPLSEEQATSPGYWSSQIRGAVRFAGGVAHLNVQGTTNYLELGPDAILTALAAEALADQDSEPTLAAALRRERSDAHSFLLGLGAMQAGGASVDFGPLFAGTGASATELPTYPFQRQRFWLETGQRAGDLGAAGQASLEHPLLGAAISLPQEGSHLFTGRISPKTHPWLADHVVAGTVIVPGTAYAELALRAGSEAGVPHLRELVFEAPLALAADGAAQLRVAVELDEAAGAHRVEIHARPEVGDGEEQPPWTRHASGSLDAEEPARSDFDAASWPPPGAEPIGTEDFYDDLAVAGVELGPAFQGLEAAWQLGEHTYAEVSLDPEQATEAERFGAHPALLDASLHPIVLGADSAAVEGAVVLFSLGDVTLYEGAGAARVRVRVSRGEDGLRVDAADLDGAAVFSVGTAVARTIDPAQLRRPAAGAEALMRLGWQPVELPGDAGEAEAVEVFESVPDPGADPATATRALTAAVLERLQTHLADEDAAGSRLAFVTENAMAIDEGESPDPAAAAVWGLLRSAQSEHPGRFVLVDSDGSDASGETLAAALQLAEEPQLALREGAARAPRLAKVGEEGATEAPSLDPEGTVLVTGGLSGLGALAARHLATAHGAKRLLLTSRRGAEAPGADELVAELSELGCEATAVACDVSDRAQVEALLAGIGDEHPLTAAVHCAGVLDDGVVESLDPDRLATVLAPKAEAAWHLHELTRELDLSAFVLYSSVAATMGSPGQGNYAAANSFLDALAQRRRAEGLPGTAIAWGLWDQEGGMGAGLSDADRARLGRTGFAAIEPGLGLELLDRALARPEALTVAVPLETAALRTAASAGLLPPLFSGLVKVNRRRAKAAAGSLARRLAAIPEPEREAFVLALVREQAADVLGHAGADAVDPEANFKDLGFDSLGAVELRNRLVQSTGVQLDATLVFDRPTVKAVAAYIFEQVEGSVGPQVVVRAARGSDEPIAIVGMGCRFPGGAASPRGLWGLVARGGDGITPFPEDRGWDEGLYDPDPAKSGKVYAREGGFLHEAPQFDPAFFGISPREALAMDPQQRLLLENAWEALEDAGIDPAELRGSSTGVYAGVTAASYLGAETATGADGLDGYLLTGTVSSVTAGRVAYTLGLEGPAVAIDTACSSSLVAMHLAAGALRGGECDMALAGGVTVIAHPASLLEFSRQGALSPDARCKAFAAGADGAGFSEGSGLLLLERLSDAERNGRQILAVIRGSATNQDGASNGLTAPNGPSQERVIRQALANAGLKPSEVDAVEAHGTGTTLGDPIEAQALLATYGQERENGPLQLGSLKSNVGHTQAAAGVGGVIKMVMALREEALPKTLHVEEPTPHVDWSQGEVELLTEQRQWKRGERPRRAGISSFGISGTNAHLIVEEAPAQAGAPEKDEAKRPPALPFALSAKSPEALAEAAGRLAAHIEEKQPDALDVAHSLLETRAQLEHRAVVVGSDSSELMAGLDALAQGKPAANLTVARATANPKAVFVLPGQGSQWEGMAAALLRESPVFAESIERCQAALGPHLDFAVRDVLEASEGAPSMERIEVVQPVLFATAVSLAELWRSHGIAPGAVIGHSQGEIAAAVIAGALSLEDGAKLAARRSALIAELTGKGAMVSVALPAERAEALIEPYGPAATLAAVNGPTAVTLACAAEVIPELLAGCEAEEIRARAVAATIPSHSHHVEFLREAVLETFADLAPREAAVPFYSTVTGEPLDTTSLTAGYWYRNLREPVRFQETTERLLADGFGAFVEISSHPVLAMALRESAEAAGRSPVVLGSLRREEGDLRRFLASLGEAHAHGLPVEFSPLFAGSGATATELPTYPFQRERYWLETEKGAGDLSAAGQVAAEHPLLGASLTLAGEGGTVMTGRISRKTHPWLADHAVGETAILPGTGFLELALRAGREVGAPGLQELILEAPLVLPEDGAVQLQVTVTANEDGTRQLRIHSRPEPGEAEEGEEGEGPTWTRHASGTLTPEEPIATDFDASAWPPAGAEPIASEDFYDLAAAAGLDYGPAFQGLEAAWKLGEHTYAEVSLAEEQAGEAERFGVHPALLDAALHAAMLGADPAEGVRLPFSFNRVSLGEAAGASSLRVRVGLEGEKVRLEAADGEGAPVVSISSISGRKVDPAQVGAAAPGGDALYGLAWTDVELAGEDAAAETAAFECSPDPGADPAESVHSLTAVVLERLRAHLAAGEGGGSRLAFVTAGAVAVAAGDTPDPAVAAVWGLVRSAQSEHPGRFLLVDTDGSEASAEALAAALRQAKEPQLALRLGVAKAPRLVKAGESEELVLPAGPWRLAPGAGGTLEELAAVENPAATAPLAPTEIRVAVGAAGLNFRDVLISLGMYPGVGAIGGEGAGTVIEVGDEVAGLAPGDRVFGYLKDAFAPVAVIPAEMVAPLPGSWSFEQGAAVPIVFATALYALTDLADLRKGERVLIHAGTGGVGMAAIGLAQHLGAEVFATASPAKWETLRDLGLDDDHIASSRDLEFREKFLAETGGEGMDVVLNSLAREFVDASLALLPRGGRFLEMGKTDVREAEVVAAEHPGASYRAFELLEAGPERLGGLLAELVTLFAAGSLAHSPISPWDVRDAKGAFRFLSQARHTGKLVLTMPRQLDPEGTVLITGGLSGLGTLTARHLATAHGAKRLLLSSRRGADAPGAAELVAELSDLGCEATAVACDVSDRGQVESLLAGIDPAHPLTAVFHSAGSLDDGTIESLDSGRLATVLAPKAEAAWHLHELTRDRDLSAFVLFSSVAAILGSPGQGNYAAANAFLDGLAQRRRAEGLPATAIAWGLWERESAMTAGLDEADRARLARAGFDPIETGSGLELLDRARAQAAPLAIAMPLRLAVLRAAASAGVLPPLLSGLVRAGRRRGRVARGESLSRRLAKVPVEERQEIVLELVREHAAAALGHASAATIDPTVNFKDLGFDSLSAVELRNRVVQATGVELEATVVFDYPTPEAIAGYLLEQVEPGSATPAEDPLEAEARRLLASLNAAQLRDSGVLEMLRSLDGSGSAENGQTDGEQSSIDEMDIDSLVRQTLEAEEGEG